MTSKITGGSAFPFGKISEVTGQPINGFYEPGLTIRDYFAAKAMQSIVRLKTLDGIETIQRSVAQQAYKMADAMLEERDK